MYLHIDFETRSRQGIEEGVTKYSTHSSTEALLVSYALKADATPVKLNEVVTLDYNDIQSRSKRLLAFEKLVLEGQHTLVAHNIAFELAILRKLFGVGVCLSRCICTMVLAAYHGLPMGLGDLSRPDVLNIPEGKLDGGTALISWFCKPDTNGNFRNPLDHPEKWDKFVKYNKYDVIAQSWVFHKLRYKELPFSEREYFYIDRAINAKGIRVDVPFINKVLASDEVIKANLVKEGKDLTGLDNIKSTPALKGWLENHTGGAIGSIDKEYIKKTLSATQDEKLKKVLTLRKEINKTSVSKYDRILKGVVNEERGNYIYDLIQFYGAIRTGRFAGRNSQIHNLPKNFMKDLDLIRQLVREGVPGIISYLKENPRDKLSQMIRTSFIADDGCTFIVADYSAIEARVLAWLANEGWKLDVFRTHGKIYEATAAIMFSMPISDIGKDSTERFFGKTCELALGYGGWLGSFYNFGADVLEQMNKTDREIINIILNWREKCANTVALWDTEETAARNAIAMPGRQFGCTKGTYYVVKGDWLCSYLPSGRGLMYYQPRIEMTKRDYEKRNNKGSITYSGFTNEDGKTAAKIWGRIATHGGKLTENKCQAIARDILCENGLKGLYMAGYDTRFHVHDECIVNIQKKYVVEHTKKVAEIMEKPIPWCLDLPLKVEPFVSEYYKK